MTAKIRGCLYIIAAPSGAGKTSLVGRLCESVEDLKVSVSHTTRAQRPGEVDHADYHFVSINQFQLMIAENAFLEHAQVFDNFYGTSRYSVETDLAAGQDVILEIDWQGAEQVRRLLPEVKSVFILPPSLETLETRLRGRGQDSEVVIQRRMRDAIAEMSHYSEFDYLVINDDFNLALAELIQIINSNRLKTNRQAALHRELIKSLLD